MRDRQTDRQTDRGIKGSKERCLLGQNTACDPIIKLQHDTETTIKQSKTMKNDMESKSTYLFGGELCPVLGKMLA